MVLDVTLDQLGSLRPTATLASHRTPIDGLYISGAGTAPTGGIAGSPGRAAARALLGDLEPGKRTWRGKSRSLVTGPYDN